MDSLTEYFDMITTEETVYLESGYILNIPSSEPAVDYMNNILPVKENIPQGEEAMRLVLYKPDKDM